MTEQSAYDRGFEARQRGEEKSANPYAHGTDDSNAWISGWQDLEEHFVARDAAFKHTFGHSW